VGQAAIARASQNSARQDAAREVLRRRNIRSSYMAWVRHRGFEPAAHHRLIIEEIERFLSSDDEVLLIFAPPGSAKSTYVSVLLPPYYLARYPSHSILAATHSVEFAERWGRRVRNDIAAEASTLGIDLASDNHAAARWALTTGGEYYGVGAGTGISGFRADLGLGDDFFGSREDAYSELVRQKRWDWYVNDFGARLKPGAKRILMNTRWHAEDVAGRVLDQIDTGVVRGRVISIPAIAGADDLLGRKPGEYLWEDPDGYDYGSFLRSRQRETSPMMWSALYQQRPSPEEGHYFKAEWLQTYEALPPLDTLHVYGGSDYAVSADRGDYTVHIVVAVDPQGRMYVVDLWRKQSASDVWVETLCDLVLRWKPLEWAEETGQIKSGVGPFLERRLRERNAFVYRRQFPTRGDKAVRAQSIRGRMAMNGLYLPANAPWVADFRHELLSFDAGRHDDQVDAIGLVGQLLDHITPGRVEAPREPPKPTELILHVAPNGQVVSNMTVRDVIEMKMRRLQREE
jgi:predicted phage terminase large subunit-like protein